MLVSSDTGRHLEIMPLVSGLERCPGCHPERSEGSRSPAEEILRCAQDDSQYLQMSTIRAGQSHLIFGTGSTSCVIMSQLSKHCCINVLYKPLENLDAIALTRRVCNPVGVFTYGIMNRNIF